jgi:hypothetical protein
MVCMENDLQARTEEGVVSMATTVQYHSFNYICTIFTFVNG